MVVVVSERDTSTKPVIREGIKWSGSLPPTPFLSKRVTGNDGRTLLDGEEGRECHPGRTKVIT